jgi:tetratricopeptide (TPR) repeat protein
VGAHRTASPSVRQGSAQVSGRIPPEVIQRIVRQNFGRFRLCYEAGLRVDPTLQGRITTKFTIKTDGSVSNITDGGSTLPSEAVRRCVRTAFTGLSFPAPEAGVVTVNYPINFAPEQNGASPPASIAATPMTAPSTAARGTPPVPVDADPLASEAKGSPYDGRFASVMSLVGSKQADAALTEAWKWRAEAPNEVLSFVALGEAAEAKSDWELAARAYGSILELWSYRVDMRRFAGERLERLAGDRGLALAADAYEGAVKDRPDHPSSHRLHAMALLRRGKPSEAFAVLETALEKNAETWRFGAAVDVLRDDLALAGASWAAADPGRRKNIESRLSKHERRIDAAPSLRVVLVWETDANDVDLHIVDGRGGHAYYAKRSLASGGTLSPDVTNGYGPEEFTVRAGVEQRAYPYKLRVHYYSRGPMGFGMGKVQIVEHDGKGKLKFEERPFVLLKDRAMVDLGEVRAPKAG